MKYRIWPRVNKIWTGPARVNHTAVYEIQRQRWWGWEYIETWASESMARDRLLQLTGPDRPISGFAQCRARAQAIAGSLSRLAARLR